MVGGEPKLFNNLNPYMKTRQYMASSTIFAKQGWYDWQPGHAKIFGVILWNYENNKKRKFKYSRTLKKQGYMRTHNYRLLKKLVEKQILEKEGRGYYSLPKTEIPLIEEVLIHIKNMDMLIKEKEPQ